MNKRQKTYAVVGGSAAVLALLGIGLYVKSKGTATAPATPAAQTSPTNTTTLPNGLAGTVTMSDGAQSVSAKVGTQIALALPSGGSGWVSLTSAALNGASILGVIPTGSTQPVPLLVSVSDTWTGVWRDKNGVTHTGTVSVSATAPQLAA